MKEIGNLKMKKIKKIAQRTFVIILMVIFSVSSIFALGIFEKSYNDLQTLYKPQLENIEFDSTLDEYILQKMNGNYIPSLAISIIQNDSISLIKGYGDQPSVDTSYMLASITKTFTATAILQLYEQEYFELDEDINNFLPFSIRNPNYPDTPITFRMLLSHTSSINGSQDNYYLSTLQDMYRKLGYMGDNETYPLYPNLLKEYFLTNGSIYSENVWINEIPGSSSIGCYANPGFDLLGYIIERITNNTLEQYLSDNIFIPLEMNNSGFNYSSFELEKLAIPYYWNSISDENEIIPHFNFYAYGAGALRTSVEDLSKFLLIHMHGGSFNGTTILEEETIELMHNCLHSDVGSGYGFGWSLNTNTNWQGHNGALPGTRTQMWFTNPNSNPEFPLGVIVMGNQGAIAGEAVTDICEKLFLEAYKIDSNDTGTSTQNDDGKSEIPSLTLYSLIISMSLLVIVKNNTVNRKKLK